MSDILLVLLLFAFVWAAVLLGPAAGARASREAEFLGSIRPDGTGDLDGVDTPRFRPALTPNARRRQVLGGLVVSMGATLALGLLPPFRIVLFVHLLLVNSCLAYVGLLVHLRDTEAAKARATTSVPVHPYAAPDDLEYTDEFSYQGDPWHHDEPAAYAQADAHVDSDSYGEAYAYADSFVDDQVTAEYGDDGGDEVDEDDDAEAEAAYIDDELRLALPA